MSVTVKLILGEQDGLSFKARHTPEIMWIMSYEAREITRQSRDLGIDISEMDEPLPRLPYRLSSILDDEECGRIAFYTFDQDLLTPEDALPGEDSAQ